MRMTARWTRGEGLKGGGATKEDYIHSPDTAAPEA